MAAQAVRDRVVQLEKLQESTDKLQKEFDEKLKALQLEYEGKYAPLYRERSVVVKGKARVAADVATPGHTCLCAVATPAYEPCTLVGRFWHSTTATTTATTHQDGAHARRTPRRAPRPSSAGAPPPRTSGGAPPRTTEAPELPMVVCT